MKKIPSLFKRDGEVLTTEFNPAAAWVIAGLGVATRKWDGTAVLVRDGKLHARYDAKHGKPPPPDFIPCQDPDPITGHWPGWVPATRPEDKWIREAHAVTLKSGPLNDWTFEACGPKIGGNPERFQSHLLIAHGLWPIEDAPRDYAGLRSFFETRDIEGVVWWRDPEDFNCEKVKITGAALGIKRVYKS